MAEEEIEVEFNPGSNRSPKVDQAERDVARAQAKFSADLERMSDAGRRLTGSILNTARPALLGVAVVTGVLFVVAVWRSRQRKSGPRIVLRAASPSNSLVRELGTLAVRTLAASAGRHLAAQLIVLAQDRVAHARLADAEAPRYGS